MELFETAATAGTSVGKIVPTTSLELKPDEPSRSGEPPSIDDYTDDFEYIND